MRHSLRLAALLVATLGAEAAHASFDVGCRTEWKVDGEEYSACNNRPFLSPSNDTRVNLRLLLAERHGTALPPIILTDPTVPLVPFDIYAWYPVEPWLEPTAEQPGQTELLANLRSIGLDLPTEQLPPALAEYEGSRCQTNRLPAVNAFLQAMEQAGLSTEERQTLALQRLALLKVCSPSESANLQPLAPGSSALATEFLAYLQASEAFYQGDLQPAGERFAVLAESRDPWLGETANYLSARVALNQAVESVIDGWGFAELAKADLERAGAATRALAEYLQQYPQGRYAGSARGLLRRAHWLAGDQPALARAYANAWQELGATNEAQRRSLLLELDGKLLFGPAPKQAEDALTLAAVALHSLRPDSPYDTVQPLDRQTLERQRPAFADAPGLYNYLDAALRLYGEHDLRGALDRLPPVPDNGPLPVLSFSEQMLRGIALERGGETRAAEAHWRALLALQPNEEQSALLQLALALNLERADRLAEIFARESPVVAVPLHLHLLHHVADAQLLRAQLPNAPAEQRDNVLLPLLHKDLLHGQYADFVADLEQVPADHQGLLAAFLWKGETSNRFECASLAQIATTLASAPHDSLARLCLGDWVRLNRVEPIRPAPADELGGTHDRFGGEPFSRLAAYQSVMDDTGAADEHRAYALYRAVYCFAPGGSNDCDGQEIPQAQRKAWFDRLKRDYPQSHWARSLKYYW